jgi:hypothetical protein
MSNDEQKNMKNADQLLLSACNAVNGLIPCYGEGLKKKWAELNGIVIETYKSAHKLPADYVLEDCVSHYNSRH